MTKSAAEVARTRPFLPKAAGASRVGHGLSERFLPAGCGEEFSQP